MKAYAMITELSNRARYVKFGVSDNIDLRITNVQCGCPLRIETVLVMDCGNNYHARVVESALHLEHSDQHSSGEWFRFPRGTSAIAEARQALKLIGERVFARAVVTEVEVKRSTKPRNYIGRTTATIRGYEPVVGDREIACVKVITRRKPALQRA